MGKQSGFTLLEVLIILGIIAILITLVLPNSYRAAVTTRKVVCVNNMRQIEAAVARWTVENEIDDGVSVNADQEDEIYSYLRGGKPNCPSGGNYSIAAIGSSPQVTCNIEGHLLTSE